MNNKNWFISRGVGSLVLKVYYGEVKEKPVNPPKTPKQEVETKEHIC